MARWIFDSDHTVAHFTARHMMVTDVHGQFNKIKGFIDFDHQDMTKTVLEIEIEANSILTGVEPRDNHLRSADFLNVETYPRIYFQSTRTEIVGSNRFEVHGELTIRNVNRPLVLHAEYFGPTYYEDETGAYTTLGFSATTHLHREDFGMKWNNDFGGGNFMVGKHIDITLNAEADLAKE
jgi:polyisoprenoid-binding protein YceI